MLKKLRRNFFQTSSLGQYLPLLKQNKDQKIIRLLRDPSNPHTIDYFDYTILDKKQNLFTKICCTNLRVLNPIGKYLLYWYILVILAIIYNYVQAGIVLIYAGAWEGQLTTTQTLIFSGFSILVLIADIILQLNTGFLRRGMIIMDRKRVVQNYLRGTLIIDIIYVLLLIACLASGYYYLNHTKYLWFLKLFRLSQIDDNIQRRFNVKRVQKTIYTIGKLMVIILFVSHTIGIIFYIIDFYLYTQAIFQPSFCWISSSTAYSPIISLPWYWQYFYSLYWGINTITTISYGDIQGSNPLQTIYVLFCMLFGFIVYGYVVNQIIKVIIWVRASQDLLRRNVLVMDLYMDNLKVPFKTRSQVRKHLKFMHQQQRNRNLNLENRMRNKLPEDLRYQLVSDAYSVMNQKITNIFQTSTATKFLFNLVQKKFTFDEEVYKQGERALSLNFLQSGKMEYIVEFGKNKQFLIYQTQSENQFLGHYELFARRRWPFSIISKAGSTVYEIDRQKTFSQINTIQILRQRFKQVQYQVIFKRNLKRIDHNCFICKANHDWTECPSQFPIFKNIFYSHQLTNNDGVRIIRRKYHTINDYKQLKVLEPIKNMSNKRLRSMIQKRIEKIKQKINQKYQSLEIDIAYDWKYYDVSQNLSKKRQLWNQMVSKNQKANKTKNQNQNPTVMKN